LATILVGHEILKEVGLAVASYSKSSVELVRAILSHLHPAQLQNVAEELEKYLIGIFCLFVFYGTRSAATHS